MARYFYPYLLKYSGLVPDGFDVDQDFEVRIETGSNPSGTSK